MYWVNPLSPLPLSLTQQLSNQLTVLFLCLSVVVVSVINPPVVTFDTVIAFHESIAVVSRNVI